MKKTKLPKQKISKLKPNWKYKHLDNKQRDLAAKELLATLRGRLILGQSFAIAYAKLKDSEPSNAEDISLIAEFLCPMFYSMELFKLHTTDGRNGYRP